MRKRFRTLIVFGLLLASLSASQLLQHKEPLKIVAFGDSNTAPRDEVGRVYAIRLEERLRSQGLKASIVNAGMRGSHTGHRKDHNAINVPHARDRYRSSVLKHDPDLVLIFFGANDAWIDGDSPEDPSRIPVEHCRENLRVLLKEFRAHGAQVVFLTPCPIGTPYPDWQYERVGEYAHAIRALAEEEAVPVIDTYHALASGEEVNHYLLDGVHLNDRGHTRVTELLMEILPWMLESSVHRAGLFSKLSTSFMK